MRSRTFGLYHLDEATYQEDLASMRRTSGIEGLKHRMRLFLEFQKMRAVVAASVNVDVAQLEAAYAELGDNAPARDDPMPVLRQRLIESETDRLWNKWLADARRCADVTIRDASFAISSSTRAPSCTAHP